MKLSSDPEASRILGMCAQERFRSLQHALERAEAGEEGMLQTAGGVVVWSWAGMGRQCREASPPPRFSPAPFRCCLLYSVGSR